MTLVFIHGSAGDSRVWQHQTAFFDDSIALDLPGHPEGSALDDVKEIAAWVWAQLDTRGVTNPVLVGHSLGGAVVLTAALVRPSEVAGLVLVGSGARLRVHPSTVELLEGFTAGKPGLREFFAPMVQHAPNSEELLDRMELVGAAATLADFTACNSFDVIDRFGELTMPILAIVGTDDVLTPPKYSEFLADNYDNVDLALIDGGTHFVFVEQPDHVNATIAAWLRGV